MKCIQFIFDTCPDISLLWPWSEDKSRYQKLGLYYLLEGKLNIPVGNSIITSGEEWVRSRQAKLKTGENDRRKDKSEMKPNKRKKNGGSCKGRSDKRSVGERETEEEWILERGREGEQSTVVLSWQISQQTSSTELPWSPIKYLTLS